MHYKLASLISTSSQKSGTAGEVYISQPDAEKERLAGKLFVLIEIDAGRANSLKLINFIINSINQNYYQNEKIILRERISSLKIEHIFETALTKTNRDLKEFLKEEKIKIKQSDLNITIGVIYENDLHFSNVGKNKAMLIYKEKEKKKNTGAKKQEDSPATYKIAVLGNNEENKSKTKNEQGFFAEVISGVIPQEGYFLFTNEALPEYLSHKQLIKIITKLPPLSAAEQIKNTLTTINAYVSFSGIIIKNSSGEPEAQISQEPTPAVDADIESADASFEDLNATEENTEKYLSPSGIINFKKWSKNCTKALTKVAKKTPQKDKIFALKDKIFVKKKTPLTQCKKILIFLKNIILYIGGFFAWFFKSITNKEKMTQIVRNTKDIPQKTKKKSKNIYQWFFSLNKKRKIAFIVGAICLLLFLASVSFTIINKKKAEQKQVFTELLENIEKRQNQIEANLLYSNEEGAKKLLKENDQFLADLASQVDEDNEKYINFINKHKKQKEKIRHVVYLEDLKEITDFNNLSSQADTNNIIYYKDKIYAGDNKQGSIYITNLDDNSATAVTDINIDANLLNYPVANKDGYIYFMDDDKVIGLNSETENMENIQISLPNQELDIVAMDGYNNRLYALDSKNNEIYKFTKINGEFSQRSNWMKEDADFSNAKDLSIDGNIYVLFDNGKIIKYFSGEEREFETDLIDPEITNASKIFASNEEDGFIYVLEKSTNRLVVFDKEGKFLHQYKSEKLDNLKDFTIDEESEIIYFLNGNKIYESSLN